LGLRLMDASQVYYYYMTVCSRAAILVIYQYKGGTVGEMGRERVDNHSLDVA
jgi:hypothetical protein